MAKQVAEGVYRLGTRWVNVNWYPVSDGEHVTIVDTGLPQYWDQFAAALNRLGCRPGDVDAVLLTHCHYDVLGSAERLRSDNDARAYIHPADADIATSRSHPRPNPGVLTRAWHPGWMISTAHAVSQGGLGLAPLTEHKPVIDGEQLDVPGRPKAIATPGHSPGHCAFWLEERGVPFCGDALVTFDATSRSRGPRLSSINTDREQALTSLTPDVAHRRLREPDLTRHRPRRPVRRIARRALQRLDDHLIDLGIRDRPRPARPPAAANRVLARADHQPATQQPDRSRRARASPQTAVPIPATGTG
jgi:glyoxylase-like metal-dependent hydrolase (beta-lactamase superfamily II)